MKSFTAHTAALSMLLGASIVVSTHAQETPPPAPPQETASPELHSAFIQGIHSYTGIGGAARDEAAAAAAFRQAAEQGLAPAQFAYGTCCRRGYGVEKNAAEAARWYRLAADQGYAPAQTYLGSLYELGEGVEKNPSEAFRLYRLAAEQGLAFAQMKLGYAYSNSIGVEADRAKALTYYTLAAQAGNAIGQNNVGWAYMEGLGVRKSYDRAIPWLKKAAAQGQANALANLGRSYEWGGLSTDENMEREIYLLYRQAVEQGLPGGHVLVGECYADGRGVKKDVRAAAAWFRIAADEGDRYGQYELGRCYEDAQGVCYDPAEAVRLYRLSAQQNNPNGMVWYARCCMDGVGGAKEDGKEILRLISEGLELGIYFPHAMTLLGECYEKGIGTPKNPQRALELYTQAFQHQRSARICKNYFRALYLGIGTEANLNKLIAIWQETANRGARQAMNELGVCYELGEGLEKDPVKAVEWYSRAAKKGNPVACYNLARCYWWGIGVEADKAEAAKWYCRSADKAFKPAMAAYERIGLKLTPVFKNKRLYRQVPLNPRVPAPNAPDPEDSAPLRAFLCGNEFYAWNDIPYKPSYELIIPDEQPVAAEDLPPEKNAKQINEELVQAGDKLWAEGRREEAIAQFLRASEKYSNEARLRLALCAFLGQGMPQNTEAAQQYITAAINLNCDMAFVLAEYIKSATE